MPQITVATYNVRHRRPTPQIRADIIRIIEAGADAVCLQEMTGHDKALERLPGHWKAHVVEPRRAGRGGRAETPILYNAARLRLVRSGFRKVSEPQKVEYDQDAGGDDVAEKTITWIRLRLTGSDRDVAIANVHAIAGIEAQGSPRTDRPRRLKVFRKTMVTLEDMARYRRSRGHVFIVAGDFNVDFSNDAQVRDPRFPYRWLTRCGITITYDRLGLPDDGTHGNRHIDYVGASAPAEPTGHRLMNLGSDHDAVLATFELPSRGERRVTT
jgi:endonuclease/exonuclease/phosphatase family metal-dependent hydrolase